MLIIGFAEGWKVGRGECQESKTQMRMEGNSCFLPTYLGMGTGFWKSGIFSILVFLPLIILLYVSCGFILFDLFDLFSCTTYSTLDFYEWRRT